MSGVIAFPQIVETSFAGADGRKQTMRVELHGEGGLLSFEHTHVDPQSGQARPILNLRKGRSGVLLVGTRKTGGFLLG